MNYLPVEFDLKSIQTKKIIWEWQQISGFIGLAFSQNPLCVVPINIKKNERSVIRTTNYNKVPKKQIFKNKQQIKDLLRKKKSLKKIASIFFFLSIIHIH